MADATVAQLEAVVAVVDYGSFTAAADILRISQPSLSRRIRALEATLGVRLFVPAGRRMVLTDTGRALLEPARRALRELTAIEAVVLSSQRLTSGSLRVAGLPSLVSEVVPEYVGRFHRRYPAVRLEIIGVEDAEELLEAVARTAVGDPVFTPGLAGLVLGEYRRLAGAPAAPEPGDPDVPRLTERETEVLRLVAKGLAYRQIAERLMISHRTVQNHVQNTLGKLQLHNRVELVRYAIERGLDEE